MIRVRLSRDGKAFKLDVTGHAGSAPKGEDLVCAGVSALCETLHMGLGRYDPQGDRELGEGTFRYRGEPGDEAQALLETFLMGFRDLAGSHPQFIKVIEE